MATLTNTKAVNWKPSKRTLLGTEWMTYTTYINGDRYEVRREASGEWIALKGHKRIGGSPTPFQSYLQSYEGAMAICLKDAGILKRTS